MINEYIYDLLELMSYRMVTDTQYFGKTFIAEIAAEDYNFRRWTSKPTELIMTLGQSKSN